MAIIYNFEDSGAFLVADTQTRRSAYAYPTSKHADEARRKDPYIVAQAMLKAENDLQAWRDQKLHRDQDEARIERICALNIAQANLR